ncbi:MAG TPA: hypothetical protein VLA99_10395, partial [Nitrospiraceae bacterium]|nr:hypothetical protein [Nitrospiraceae bacterium]
PPDTSRQSTDEEDISILAKADIIILGLQRFDTQPTEKEGRQCQLGGESLSVLREKPARRGAPMRNLIFR